LQQLRPQAHFGCFHVGKSHALGLYSFHAGGWLQVREHFFVAFSAVIVHML
jgi:hypothetical protein